jgi:tripartite-type tricarboxylate transporter receptor subunit TctC
MLLRSIGALVALLGAALAAHADVYKDKTITLTTSQGAGGTNDVTARLIARHMARHIPGQPTIVVQNMPGAGNVLATNFLYNVASKDGTAIGTVHNTIPLHQALSGDGVRYDTRKFNWLGSTGAENAGLLVWHATGVKTFNDVMRREIVIGGTGVGSGTVMYATAMNNMLGTRFKIVHGYRASEHVSIAMERGEVDARTMGLTGVFRQHAQWVKDGRVVLIAQLGSVRDRRLPDVPLLQEIAKTEEQRQLIRLISSPESLGSIYLMPPDVPADRLAILRNAFDATMRDSAFLEDAVKLRLYVDPMSGAQVAGIIDETINAPPGVIAKAVAVSKRQDGGQK